MSPMSTTPEQLLATAEAADKANREAMAALREALQRLGDRLLPVGSVIDLRQRPLPEHLATVKTIRGNARGSHKFQIAEAPQIEISIHHFELATWSCEAFPLSEKTGLPMSGATNSHWSKETVKIRGHFLNPYDLEKDLSQSRRRFLDVLAGGVPSAGAALQAA